MQLFRCSRQFQFKEIIAGKICLLFQQYRFLVVSSVMISCGVIINITIFSLIYVVQLQKKHVSLLTAA